MAVTSPAPLNSTSLAPLNSKPESLTELVLDRLQEAIVSKQLAPGTRVSEATLAELLGVSKTPVREALLRLRHVGLVTIAGGGLRVVEPSIEIIRNAYELRAGLERSAASHAATRRSDEDSKKLMQLARSSVTSAEKGTPEDFREADARFHQLVARCSGNPSLESAIDDVRLLTSAVRLRDAPATGDSGGCATEHVFVAQAIDAGDDATAGQAMEAHVRHVMETVLSSFVNARAEG